MDTRDIDHAFSGEDEARLIHAVTFSSVVEVNKLFKRKIPKIEIILFKNPVTLPKFDCQ